MEKSPVTPPGIDPGTVRLVAQRLNHYATPGSLYVGISQKNFRNNETHKLDTLKCRFPV